MTTILIEKFRKPFVLEPCPTKKNLKLIAKRATS